MARFSAPGGDTVGQTIGSFLVSPYLRTVVLVTYSYSHGLTIPLPDRQGEAESRFFDLLMIAATNARITFLTATPKGPDVAREQRFLERLARSGITVLTRPDLHAKVYLFEEETGRQCWITGSSNLSSSGLTSVAEVNLIGYHPVDFANIRLLTNELIDHAIPVT